MKIKSIKISFIPHKRQRYNSLGDWIVGSDGNHEIFISQFSDERYSWLVAIHEMIELILCLFRNISQKEVDDFDMQFEKEREEGLHSPEAEPGDSPLAIYRREHFTATNIERILAPEFGISWHEYEKEAQSI